MAHLTCTSYVESTSTYVLTGRTIVSSESIDTDAAIGSDAPAAVYARRGTHGYNKWKRVITSNIMP